MPPRAVRVVERPSSSQRAMWSSRCHTRSPSRSLEAADRRMFVYNPRPVLEPDPTAAGTRTRALLPADRARRRSPPDAGDLPGWVGGDARVPRRARTRGARRPAGRDLPVPRAVPGSDPVPPRPRRVDRRLRRHQRAAAASSTHPKVASRSGPRKPASERRPGHGWRYRADRLERARPDRGPGRRGRGRGRRSTFGKSETGFPFVVATGEAELARGFGEAGGPQLAFGDSRPEADIVSQLDSTIFLGLSRCGGFETEVSSDYGAICLGDGRVFASIYGDREFVASVIDGLRVEDFRPA